MDECIGSGHEHATLAQRWRACTEALAAMMELLRQTQQADTLLEMLRIDGESN